MAARPRGTGQTATCHMQHALARAAGRAITKYEKWGREHRREREASEQMSGVKEAMSSSGERTGKGPPPPSATPVGSTEVLQQRRKLPHSPATMAVGGFLIVAAIGYFALYSKSKPGTTPADVTRASNRAPKSK
ncbi:hypothetical protein GW17_00028724 [Ensete ventricosum]|nr:hypothetical protein GW17_00028724 [Ensete ventricosum]